MKIDFSDINIEPMPNPKRLTVQRVNVAIVTEDDKGNVRSSDSSVGYIRNASVHPAAHTGRW